MLVRIKQGHWIIPRDSVWILLFIVPTPWRIVKSSPNSRKRQDIVGVIGGNDSPNARVSDRGAVKIEHIETNRFLSWDGSRREMLREDGHDRESSFGTLGTSVTNMAGMRTHQLHDFTSVVF